MKEMHVSVNSRYSAQSNSFYHCQRSTNGLSLAQYVQKLAQYVQKLAQYVQNCKIVFVILLDSDGAV